MHCKSILHFFKNLILIVVGVFFYQSVVLLLLLTTHFYSELQPLVSLLALFGQYISKRAAAAAVLS